MSAQLVKSNQEVPYSVSLVATPAANAQFAGWYIIENGKKSIFSTDSSTTKELIANATIGASFVQAGVSIYASVAGKGYDSLATALSEAQAGESISIYSNVTLDESAGVAPGVTLSIASGVTLTIASGKTLYVDGTVANNGAISGTVSKCTKLIQQTGDGTVNAETGKPNPFIPYDGVKYWRTTTTTPSISVSSSESHITIVNGYGNVFRTSATTAKALVCTVDMSTAVNHITSINTDFTSFKLAYESARQSATAGSGTSQSIHGNSKLIVMLANDTSASESGDQRYGFMVDCAGCNLAFTATLKSNYDVVILNCPYTGGNQLKSTVTNTRVHFFNCTKAGVKINSKNSTIVNCYDCGNLSISYDPTTVQSGEVNIYSGGPYSATFNKLWHVYGGTFTSNPSSPTDYLWDSANYEVKQEGSYFKVVEKKPTVYVAYTLTGTTTNTYESLSEAISDVANGGTVYLMQDIELDADLAIDAGREVTIELISCDISGHRIVNSGVLHLEDRKMTSNPGTVSSGIVNNGTITIAYGEYTGSVELNGGMFTVYNGTVDGSITVASSVEDPATVANLKGGQFASRLFSHGSESKDISTICEAEESEHVVRAKDGRFRVARFPAAIVTDTGTMSLSAVALDSTDSSLWTRFASAPTRANFTAAEWYRACELQSTFDYYQTQGIDCAVLVDRLIAAGTLSVSAPVVGTQAITADIQVSEFGYSALLPMIRDYPRTPPYAPWAYSTFLPGGEHSSLSFGLSNGNSANNGTLLIAQMRLASDIQSSSGKKDYSYTQYDVIGSRKYVINAGSNKAMIRPASGAATFYATPAAAMDAAANGGTVMLANDCDTAFTLSKEGTYTFDTMGFAYAGGEPAVGTGLRIASVTTNAVDSSAKVLVPDAMTITYVVEDARTIECGENKYVSIEEAVVAASGDTIAVTVTADDTETVTLPQGKTLEVTVEDGVSANVTVNAGDGAFIEAETSGTTTTYTAKQITVEMAEPSSVAAVEMEKIDNGSTNAVSDPTLVSAVVAALMGNVDVPRTDNTDKLDIVDVITVTPTKIVQEVVGAATAIIRAATFDVVPTFKAGQSLGEGQKLKFRLPVDAVATQIVAIVYHNGAQFGIYPVQTYNNAKFIEVESDAFSPYGYTLLDGETTNPVAAIGTTGYVSLAAAVAAAQAGDTITMLADDNVSLTGGSRLTINKSLTITGPVGANGEPLYTIYGKSTETGTNNIYIDGDGTVTLSNLKIESFGNEKGTDASHAPVYVASSFTGRVNLDNLQISDFNRGGIFLYGGTFNVTNCYVDCANSRSGAFTKGIEIKGTATGSITDTLICNMERSGGDAPAGIEIYGSGSIVVDRCTIISDVGSHHSVRATYGIVSSRVGDHDPSGGSLHVTDCTIDVSNAALSVADHDEYGPVNNYSIVVDGEDTSFSNYIATWSATSSITINEGEFTEDVYADSGTITITGGTFNNFAPYTGTGGTIAISGGEFDAPVLDEYCAEGFIPAAQDPDTGLYTVKTGDYVAEVFNDNFDSVGKFETLQAAIDAAQDGYTVQLLTDIEDVADTFRIYKSITIDGDGCTISAVTNSEPRNVIDAYSGARVLFQVGDTDDDDVIITNIELDGGTSHYYTYLIEAKHGKLTVEDVVLLHGGEANESGAQGVGYGAGIHLNGANLVVEGDFIADTGGEAEGIFPFTGILYDGGTIAFADGVDADIGDDLLLVGMGPLNVDDFMENYDIETILEDMNVPDGFIPYTLSLDGSSSGMGFVGASPLGWNQIIDYGKEIMDVSSAIGYDGLDKESTPVEVGLLTDTVLPDTFKFADTNLTVNGNGNALSGEIEYTDNAGIIEDIVMGTEGDPLVLNMTNVSHAIEFGAGVEVTNVTIILTESQATAGTPIIIWDADNGVEAPANEEGVTVRVVDEVSGQPTGETAELIWDDEMGMAYIGPCDARLTGPTHTDPIYTTLSNAVEQAAASGDTVTLMTNVTLTARQTIDKSIVFDLNGKVLAANGDAILIDSGAAVQMFDAGTVTGNIEVASGSLTITNGIYVGNLGKVDGAQIAISGGFFTNIVPVAYCADGYFPVATPVEIDNAYYYTVTTGYAVGDVLDVAGAGDYALSSFEAEYLNSILRLGHTKDGEYGVSSAVTGMVSVAAFTNAASLNIDITQTYNDPTYEPDFRISAIKRDRTARTVTVTVSLDRDGKEVSKNIYGTLVLKTSSDAHDWRGCYWDDTNPSHGDNDSDDDGTANFSKNGSTVSFTMPISDNGHIFKAIIVDPAAPAGE